MSDPVIVQSPGVVGVASETIGALKGSPILIVMVVLNCAFLGAASFYLSRQQENITRLVDRMFDRCLPDVHPEARELPPAAGDHRP